MVGIAKRSLILFIGLILMAAMLGRGVHISSAQVQQPLQSQSSAVGSAAGGDASLTEATLAPDNDASVASGGQWSADQNLGGLDHLMVGWNDGGVYRSYLLFNVSNLPANVQIDSAQLLLTPMNSDNQALTMVANVVQQQWDESSITWNAQPINTWQAGAANWNPNQGGQIAVDITPAVQNWYACGGSTNNGIELSADLSVGSYVAFASRKSSDPPILDIKYEPSNSPPTCAAPPPETGVSLSTPGVTGPSSSGSSLGSNNPNQINGALPTAVPTPCQIICVVSGATINSSSGGSGGTICDATGSCSSKVGSTTNCSTLSATTNSNNLNCNSSTTTTSSGSATTGP